MREPVIKDSKSVTIQEMLDAALEAVDYVSQANWRGRETAARAWLRRISTGDRGLTIDQIAELQEDARESRARESRAGEAAAER